MNLLFSLGGGRWSATTLKGWLTGWLVAEVLAFLLAVKLLGLGLTLLALLGTSLLGVAILRRAGLGAAQHLRRAVAGDGTNAAFVDGTLTALGALLLIMPGFVSDAVGLVLATPSLRQALAARFLGPGTASNGPAARPARPDIIDLAPEDWRVVDKSGARQG